MNTFNEADHPRGGNPNNPGQFAHKTLREAECSLSDEQTGSHKSLIQGFRRKLGQKPEHDYLIITDEVGTSGSLVVDLKEESLIEAIQPWYEGFPEGLLEGTEEMQIFDLENYLGISVSNISVSSQPTLRWDETGGESASETRAVCRLEIPNPNDPNQVVTLASKTVDLSLTETVEDIDLATAMENAVIYDSGLRVPPGSRIPINIPL